MIQSQMIQTETITKNNQMYIAFELSNKEWKLLFSNGVKRRQRTINAGDLISLEKEIDKSKRKLGVSETAKINSCYEAGRDGFWIHRHLESIGVNNIVVDPASIEVNRRYRRAKTDRMDVVKLLNMLIRYLNGEGKPWGVLRVPTIEQEDIRRLHREIGRLKKEKTAHTNRIKSLFVLHGIQMSIGRYFLQQLERAVQWNGEKLPSHIKNEILREYKRYELIKQQLKEIEAEKKEILASGSDAVKKVLALQNLKGIGPVGSWTLVFEYFGWRKFKNVKQVGAASGLVPTPYNSGDSDKEQGISKAGNQRIRRLMVELSWGWLRYQPQSSLSQWFMKRFGQGGKRMRRVGIVALARKLLIALWKYLEQSLVPEGSVLKVIA
jgi:transposase